MNDWLIGLILLPIVLAETGELAPWLARKTLQWGARCLGEQQARERYGEEWSADLEHVPGKLTKLGYAATVVLVSVPRLRLRAWRHEREVPGMRAASARAITALDTADDVDTLANLIASGVACSLGFLHVTVNVATADAQLRCLAAVGPQDMRDQMLGNTCPKPMIEDVLCQGTRWGTLRLIRDFTAIDEKHVYTPKANGTLRGGPDAWDSDCGLLAPLCTPSGALLGLLSLDMPVSGRIPGPAHRAVLEAYAAQAAERLLDLHQQIAPRQNPTAP